MTIHPSQPDLPAFDGIPQLDHAYCGALRVAQTLGDMYLPRVLTLGAKTKIPSRSMVSSLWVLKQFAHPISNGSMVSSFKKYPPMCPLHNQWVKSGYFSKSTIHITRHMIGGYRGGYFVIKMNSTTTPSGYWGGYFLKELTMDPLGMGWANCFRTHNELTMDPWKKWV